MGMRAWSATRESEPLQSDATIQVGCKVPMPVEYKGATAWASEFVQAEERVLVERDLQGSRRIWASLAWQSLGSGLVWHVRT